MKPDYLSGKNRFLETSSHPYRLVVKGRRVGFTAAMLIESVSIASQEDCEIMIVCHSVQRTHSILEECVNVSERMGYKISNNNNRCLQINNRGIIRFASHLSLGCIRGMRINRLYIDEVQFMPAESVYNIASRVIGTGGYVTISRTSRYFLNAFHVALWQWGKWANLIVKEHNYQ